MIESLRKLISSNVTAMAFAVVTSTAIGAYLGAWQNVIVYVAGLVLGLYIILFILFLLRDAMKIRSWSRNQKYPVSYTCVDHDWRIGEQADFHGKYSFVCRNDSVEPISVLPFDDVWFHDYEKMDIRVKVADDEKKYKISEYRQSVYGFALTLLSRVMRFRAISWAHIVEPALCPGDEIRYEISISTPGTEKDAFDEKGAYAGIPANIPTRKAKLNLAAPKGFKFNLLEPVIVIDQKGNRYSDDERRTAAPSLNSSKTLLTWEIDSLVTGKRYWFHYRFEAA